VTAREHLKWSYTEIVGVVGDVKYLGLARPPEPAFYVPLTQNVSPVFLVVRSTVSAASVTQKYEPQLNPSVTMWSSYA
jgi:hypothetical protein